MFRPTLVLGLLVVAAAVLPAVAASQQPGVCARPDTIAVRGNERIGPTVIRADAGISPGDTLNLLIVKRAMRNLYASGQFDDVRISCEPALDGSRATLIIEVDERPLLGDVAVEGTDKVSQRSVRDRVDILVGQPVDPAQVARIVQRIDSLYDSQGYYLATITPETTTVGGRTKITFRIDEGRRLAVSGVDIDGNVQVRGTEIVGAMKTKPEGFWWWRRGEFDDDEYAADLGENIPKLYASRGMVDFQIVDDTLIVDPERGKALIRIQVDEGEKYRVGAFEVAGNKRFSSEEVSRFFPFTERDPSITERLRGLVARGNGNDADLFDQAEWDEATQRVNTAYYNEGYISARITPVIERVVGLDSVPRVNLRWEIQEGQPSIINRVEIAGNDYTTESCIRDQLLILPGDVFNYDRLIRSYQSISNLGFFEQPLPFPDTRQANEKGDVDIVFNVKEKRTGSVNFGASMGQGTGVGGFLGLDQPNVFGQCKRVSLNWQFGRYINDFQLSFTDPSVRQSRISGTISAYHTRSRFIVADLGRQTRSGGSLQFGFPVPWSPFTRVFLSYGGEHVRAGGGLFDRDTSFQLQNGFRSSLGLTTTHDTRIDMPFATAGGMQTISGQFNGGPLGGDTDFQRYTGEFRAYAPLGQFGGTRPGSQPAKFVLGLTARAGAVFGDVGPFLFSQKFALGGTQFGEMLRGYEEFSITPLGVVTGTSNYSARRESFGNAFLTTTAELGLRLNQQVYANLFFDAGNIWNRPRELDPTRLYRGAGIGVALVTPLGPLGLDWAYGFDRLDVTGRPDPAWQLHFRLGNIF
ncbi:MAG: outer membrane protein assembly factor BamA [Gemmatimonadota bacterium]|nr:outer membrane protein assembly factor BamA [Gemmatimonadota bacterium]